MLHFRQGLIQVAVVEIPQYQHRGLRFVLQMAVNTVSYLISSSSGVSIWWDVNST